MSLRKSLYGTGVALVTPFKSNSEVDLEALSKIIDHVINGGTEYVVTISALLTGDWHIYSMHTPVGGPVPTTFSFKRNPLVTLDGNLKESGNVKTVHDEIFGIDVKYYGETVSFVQTIKLKSTVKTNLSGTIKYMVCNDKMCLPPKTVPFNIQLN